MGWNQFLTKCNSGILKGLSGEDEVEKKRPLVEFFRCRGRDEAGIFFPFPRPFRGQDKEFLWNFGLFLSHFKSLLLILVFRGKGQDEVRNYASSLSHFEVETRPSRTSDVTLD